jgi:hypothetical protein
MIDKFKLLFNKVKCLFFEKSIWVFVFILRYDAGNINHGKKEDTDYKGGDKFIKLDEREILTWELYE